MEQIKSKSTNSKRINMKNTLKILATNWINITGIFISVLIYSVIYGYINTAQNILQLILGSSILIFLYGVIFWSGFLITILMLDIVIIILNKKNNLKKMLLVEWLIISIPFFYWAIKYKQWVFLVAIIAFFITQLLRAKMIEKINTNY